MSAISAKATLTITEPLLRTITNHCNIGSQEEREKEVASIKQIIIEVANRVLEYYNNEIKDKKKNSGDWVTIEIRYPKIIPSNVSYLKTHVSLLANWVMQALESNDYHFKIRNGQPHNVLESDSSPDGIMSGSFDRYYSMEIALKETSSAQESQESYQEGKKS